MTYLLEGRILTLQRPDAAGARLVYALVANILVGIGGFALVVSALSKMGAISPRQAGFRGPGHAVVVVVVVGAGLGFVFFAVYHFAHSPPFDTVGFVVLLTAIGLITSLFYFVSRDVYGTIAFHNFLGIFGVIRALESSGNLASFERPVVPLLITAVVTVALLVAAHVLWLGRGVPANGSAQQPSRVR